MTYVVRCTRQLFRLAVIFLMPGLFMGQTATADPAVIVSRHRSQPVAKDHDNVIAVSKTVRRVSMYYRLDLKKDNAHASQVAQVMRQHEDKIRSCYTRRLDAGHHLKGKIALGIRMSRALGSITKVVRLGGSLKDPSLLRCINRELTRLSIQPPSDFQGTLEYDFGFQHDVPRVAIQ